MSRKALSSIDWMQKSVDDIFAEPLKEIESSSSPNVNTVHQKIEHFERKAKLNFNKSRPAPPPPGTQIHLPKIGNYQPKILLSRNNSKAAAPKSPYSDVEVTREPETNRKSFHEHSEQTTERKRSESTERKRSESECNINTDESGIYSTIEITPDYDLSKKEGGEERKCMIIGDKDTPMVLGGSFIEEESDTNNINYTNLENSINIESKDELKENKVFTDHDNVVNLGEVVVNPLFEGKALQDTPPDNTLSDNDTPRHPYKKRRAPGIPSSYVNRHRHNSQSSHNSDEEYPYIPDPDYEEEEATMNFNGIPSKERYQAQRRDKKVIKEYDGEDFSKYMNDDDEGFEDHTYTWRKNIRHHRKPTTTQKQPPIPKSKYTERSMLNASKLKPLLKKPKNIEVQHGSMNMKRQTLRDISYADCKMGLDDRTVRSVKSTSAGGRYIKRGKERTMIVDGDIGDGGYEEFLRMRHKEDGSLESNSSGDSGLETDLLQQEQFYHKMQPKKLREKQGKPGNLWEKFTWRFKRHAYRMS